MDAAKNSYLVAVFDDPATAREAARKLEGHGLDADDVGVAMPATTPTKDAVRGGELAQAGDFARFYGTGAALGAGAGAAVAVAVVLLIGSGPVGLATGMALLGGGIAGAFMGGFWGVAKHLPVNEEALDTYTSGTVGPVRLEVRLREPERSGPIAGLLRECGAKAVEPRATAPR